MANEVKNGRELIIGATYQKIELIRILEKLGFTIDAMVEFPGSESVGEFEKRNLLPLEGRIPDSYGEPFFVNLSQEGKETLRFRYDPRKGYLYLG